MDHSGEHELPKAERSKRMRGARVGESRCDVRRRQKETGRDDRHRQLGYRVRVAM